MDLYKQALSTMASVTRIDLELAKQGPVHVSFGGMLGFLFSPDGAMVHLLSQPRDGGQPVEFPIRFEDYGRAGSKLLVDIGLGQVAEAVTMFG